METKKAEAPALSIVDGHVSRQEVALANWQAPTPDVQLVQWTPERIQLIKQQVVKRTDVPDSAFAYFIEVCKRADLDPLLKQAYLIRRSFQDENDQWQTVWEPQWAEAGLESRADRFPDYGGIQGAAVYEKDVFEIDESAGTVTHKYNPTQPRGQLKGAWAKITRKGRHVPISWLPFQSRVQTKRNGEPTKFWKNDPEGMIKKCARAEQLRWAYPNAFAGMYVEGELATDEDKDDAPKAQQTAQQEPVSDAKGVEGAKSRVKAAAKKAEAEAPKQEATVPAAGFEPVATPEGDKGPAPKAAQTSAPTGPVATFGGPDFKGKPIASLTDEGLRALMELGNRKLNEVLEKKQDPEPKWAPDVRACVSAVSMELALRASKAAAATPTREPGDDSEPDF